MEYFERDNKIYIHYFFIIIKFIFRTQRYVQKDMNIYDS